MARDIHLSGDSLVDSEGRPAIDLSLYGSGRRLGFAANGDQFTIAAVNPADELVTGMSVTFTVGFRPGVIVGRAPLSAHNNANGFVAILCYVDGTLCDAGGLALPSGLRDVDFRYPFTVGANDIANGVLAAGSHTVTMRANVDNTGASPSGYLNFFGRPTSIRRR